MVDGLAVEERQEKRVETVVGGKKKLRKVTF